MHDRIAPTPPAKPKLVFTKTGLRDDQIYVIDLRDHSIRNLINPEKTPEDMYAFLRGLEARYLEDHPIIAVRVLIIFSKPFLLWTEQDDQRAAAILDKYPFLGTKVRFVSHDEDELIQLIQGHLASSEPIVAIFSHGDYPFNHVEANAHLN